MSVISDVKQAFSSNSTNNDYVLFGYPNQADAEINIYGVLSQGYAQDNQVADRPLEQSNFTSDSVQIKPYILTVRGIILPDQQSTITDYQSLSTYISNKITELQNYSNGTQLFTLYNTFSFGSYQPLKLVGFRYETNVDLTLPEFVLMLKQIQSSTATTYSTTNTSGSNVSQPQNQTQKTTQG